MTTTSTAQNLGATPATCGPTTRVAPREIRDVAYRALRVAGATSGEASLAARAVLEAELSDTSPDGLAMLLQELGTVCSARVPAQFLPGPVPVLQDPAGRGLFFAVPAGVEHLLAHPEVTSVLLPAVLLRPGAHAVAAVTAGERAGEIELRSQSATATGPAGVLVHLAAARSSSGPEPGTRSQAETTGVLVDAAQWTLAEAAASPYLVPEQ